MCIRLFKRPDEAEQESHRGLIRLYELELNAEMKGLKRSLQDLSGLADLYWYAGGSEGAQQAAYAHLMAYLFDRKAIYPLTRARFERGTDEARVRMQGLVPRFVGLLGTLLETHREISLMAEAYPGMKADLARLLPPDFLGHVPFAQLPHFVRYLKAMKLRGERARLGPTKDRQKAEQVQPFQDALDDLLKEDPPPGSRKREAIEGFRWMIEELRVSVFAQELGTAQKVSPKRLAETLEEVRRLG